MAALAFDFTYETEVAPAPRPRRRLYAVRGTVDGPAATAVAPTLDALLGRTWSALAAGRLANCPVCSGPMRPHHGTGRCGDCGTTLD